MKKFGKALVVAAITSSLVVMPLSAAPDVEAIKKEKSRHSRRLIVRIISLHNCLQSSKC